MIQSLAREGVEVIFGLPGVQIMEIYDALFEQPGIRLITVRHEQSAGYMADGYARTTGRVGVALVVPGPGALNASAAIGTAYASSSPVMLVSGQIDTNSLGQSKGALHEINDQLDVFSAHNQVERPYHPAGRNSQHGAHGNAACAGRQAQAGGNRGSFRHPAGILRY